MLESFTDNELTSSNQPGFKPGDSCINQLLCIAQDIHQTYDNGLETRAVFLDISKAFDKVWHEGISGNLLLNIIKYFLSLRKQGVVLGGQRSTWVNIGAGVSQGSIIGHLFFLIYINDLSDDLTSNPRLFMDDTSLFSVVQNINSSTINLNSNLNKTSDRAFQWKMNFNPDPNKQAQEVILAEKLTKLIIHHYFLIKT